MPHRKKILTGLVILLIFLVSSFFYLLIDGRNKQEVLGAGVVNESTVAQQLLIPEDTEALVDTSEDVVYSSLDVCYESNCYYITPEVIEGFYQENQLNTRDVYMYVLEYIVPYFEKLSGGKVLVKNSKGSFNTWKEDEIVDIKNIYEEITNVIEESGLEGVELKHSVYKRESPGTDGKYAEKYIEIDNSRQKLYAWKDGEVIKEIDLSAAKEGFEVYGVFPIIDKGIVPQAPSGRYMPYWMAFYYSPSQDSWYGLHGLVWWYDEAGNKVYETTEYIGVRRSTGCIRMLFDDAKYLYERYEKGDPILIHE